MTVRELVLSNEEVVPTTLVTLYEVIGPDGIAIWGGTDANDAMYWFRRKSPAGSTIAVQTFDEDGEEAWPTGDSIDITSIVVAAIAGGLS